MYTIRETKLVEQSRIESFYHSVNEEVSLQPSERIIIAEDGTDIIGAARLAKENDVFVLRTVNVIGGYQKQGVGTEILNMIMNILGKEACYCLSYPDVTNFYTRFGFQIIEPNELPSFLYKRFMEYKQSFPIVAMHRKRNAVSLLTFHSAGR